MPNLWRAEPPLSRYSWKTGGGGKNDPLPGRWLRRCKYCCILHSLWLFMHHALRNVFEGGQDFFQVKLRSCFLSQIPDDHLCKFSFKTRLCDFVGEILGYKQSQVSPARPPTGRGQIQPGAHCLLVRDFLVAASTVELG